MAAALGVSAAPAPVGAQPPTRLQVGAYYFLWYPRNLGQGTLRAHLVPRQMPSPATLASNDPTVAARDIAAGRRAGITFFAVDWWPRNPTFPGWAHRDADAAMTAFLAAPDIGRIKFAMFYETANLGFDPGLESTPVTPAKEQQFDADMVDFARRYFVNPDYLFVDGRPVVFLYLTRTLTGDVAGMMRGARQALAPLGYDPYFVGDEVYWRVTPLRRAPWAPVLTTAPQVARIEAFDAVTAYSLYYGDPEPFLGPTRDFVGYPGTTPIVTDEVGLLAEYRRATGGRVPVVPDVSPGFNDRGVRLATEHPAEPRQWVAGAAPASTLDHLFNDVAVPSVDPGLPMVMVTTWNEWNEDTFVEPVGGTPTAVDDSPFRQAYTQGYRYGGEGSSDVATLRRDIASADRSHPWVRAAPPAAGH
ncbi:MAG TPA: hypothetical protein VKG43_12300 [Acidimicrobiales bacterium]|nr:hypothetical protein [Acidimicrobiales bacterium]